MIIWKKAVLVMGTPEHAGLDPKCLGPERVDFVAAGSQKAISLAAASAPSKQGWFPDPLSPDNARFFNGSKWVGLQRRILSDAEVQTAAATAAAHAADADTARANWHPKPHADPGAVMHSPQDRIVTDCTLLLASGLDVNHAGATTVSLRSNDLEFWGRDSHGVDHVTVNGRDHIADVEVSGGELTKSGGGFIGGGFGLEGAAVGIATSTILNALTTRTKHNPAVLIVTSDEGLIAVSTASWSVLELRGHLAPMFADAIRYRANPRHESPPLGTPPTSRLQR